MASFQCAVAFAFCFAFKFCPCITVRAVSWSYGLVFFGGIFVQTRDKGRPRVLYVVFSLRCPAELKGTTIAFFPTK